MTRRKNHFGFGFIFTIPWIIAIIVSIIGVTAGVIIYKQVTKSTSTPETTMESRFTGYGCILVDKKIYKSSSLEGPWIFDNDNTLGMQYITQIHDGTFIGIDSNTFIYTSGSLSGPWNKVSKNNTNKFTFITEYKKTDNSYGFIGTNKTMESILISTDFNTWVGTGSTGYVQFSCIVQLPDGLFTGENSSQAGRLTTLSADLKNPIANYGLTGTLPNTQIILSIDKTNIIVIKDDNNLYTTNVQLSNSTKFTPVTVKGPVTQFQCIFTLK